MELMKLSIPTGWVIFDNKFFDVEPIPESSGFISNFYAGFVEDVLWLESVFDKENISKVNYWSIDLSWLPDSRIEGFYYLRLFWCSKNNMELIEELETKSRFEIREKLEFWLNDISSNYSIRLNKMLEIYGNG